MSRTWTKGTFNPLLKELASDKCPNQTINPLALTSGKNQQTSRIGSVQERLSIAQAMSRSTRPRSRQNGRLERATSWLRAPSTDLRAFNALRLLPPNVMATATVMMDRTSVTPYFLPPIPRELVNRTKQFRHPVHCALLGTSSRRVGQRLLRILRGSTVSARSLRSSIAFSSKDRAKTVSASTTPDTTHAGIRTHAYEHQSPINRRSYRYVCEKDHRIITKLHCHVTCHTSTATSTWSASTLTSSPTLALGIM